MVGTRVEISVGVLLHEDPSSDSEGGISHDKEWFGGVWHLYYWSGEEHFFEFDECVILFLSP